MRTATITVLVLCAFCHAGSAYGQAQPPARGFSALGGSVGRILLPFDDDENGFFTVSFHFTQVRRGDAGVDIAVTTVPAALAEGGVLIAPSIGAALGGSAGPGGFAFLRAGGTLAAAVSSGGGGALLGLYVGAGGVINTGKTAGLRIDVTRHMAIQAPKYGIWEVSLGLSRVLANKARPPRDSLPQ